MLPSSLSRFAGSWLLRHFFAEVENDGCDINGFESGRGINREKGGGTAERMVPARRPRTTNPVAEGGRR